MTSQTPPPNLIQQGRLKPCNVTKKCCCSAKINIDMTNGSLQRNCKLLLLAKLGYFYVMTSSIIDMQLHLIFGRLPASAFILNILVLPDIKIDRSYSSASAKNPTVNISMKSLRNETLLCYLQTSVVKMDN